MKELSVFGGEVSLKCHLSAVGVPSGFWDRPLEGLHSSSEAAVLAVDTHCWHGATCPSSTLKLDEPPGVGARRQIQVPWKSSGTHTLASAPYSCFSKLYFAGQVGAGIAYMLGSKTFGGVISLLAS